MRNTVKLAGLIVLGILYWITWSALNGSEPLPSRIATHFDMQGQPNAWGSPHFLWLLPLVGTGLYLGMTVLASIRFSKFNLPVPVTQSNLPFIQRQTSGMVAWINLEVLGLFTYIQSSIIEGARTGTFHISPSIIPVFLVVIFATIGWHLAAIIRGARAHAESNGPMKPFQN